jgi:hypothetical protein
MVEEATIRAGLDYVDKQFAGGRRLGGSLMDKQQTFGERAVGLSFNPSGDETVRQFKEAFAEIIDLCDGARTHSDDPETKRLWSVAITEAQTAQMWAVKAATWRK